MKRKLVQSGQDDRGTRLNRPGTDDEVSRRPPPAPRQRQPQTSCDFCRLKKLKCDRAAPCSTCVTRGHRCDGPPVPLTRTNPSSGQRLTPDATPPEPNTANSKPQCGSGLLSVPLNAQENILERLRMLEQAVFGPSGSSREGPVPNHTPATGDGTQLTVTDDCSSTSPGVGQPDYATACDSVSSPADYHNIEFRVAQSSRLIGTRSASLTDELPDHNTLGGLSRTIWLPSKEGLSALLSDYVQGQHMFLGIIDPYATRQLIDQVYSDVPQRKASCLSHIALLLAIAATSAFFWDKDDDRLEYHFSSAFDAANCSVSWRNSSWDVLDQLRRDVTGSLEELQATCVLAHLISQIEGCPSRYRRLQGNAITIAREISLHVIDAPRAFLPWDRHLEGDGDLDAYQVLDTEAVREIKRRVWWHLAGTDWLLSVMGGPLYKSYTINPLHMNVRYPRNINDGDLQNLTPWPKASPREWPNTTRDPPTTYTYSILRLRVAEICHKIVDALQPIAYTQLAQNGDGVEQLPYDEILRISRLFDDALASFPPSYRLDAPIPAGAPVDVDLQRRVLLLYFHARRARIFRPFLRSRANTSTKELGAGSRGGLRHTDLGYDHFADLCRESARTVLKIASSLINKEMPTPNTTTGNSTQHHTKKPRIVHRCGLILMHLFMACVILATDPTLSPSNSEPTSDVADRRRELSEGCYVLKIAGQRSSLASGLMESLTVVLNRHKLRGFCHKGHQDNGPQTPTASGTGKGTRVDSGYPLTIQGLNQQGFSSSKTFVPHQQQTRGDTLSTRPIPSSFVAAAADDDREGVNDIWDIDRIQERVLAQHVQRRNQQMNTSASGQSPAPDVEVIESTAHQHNASTSEAVFLPLTVNSQLLPLDGLWKDLVDAASGPSLEGLASQNMLFDGQVVAENVDYEVQWDHLFADLDYFVGPS